MLNNGFRVYLTTVLLLLGSVSLASDNLTQVSLQLIWKHQFQFAGYYMAIHKGYYRDAGIDLTIHEYEGDIDPVKSVLNGNRDFAVGRSTILAQKTRGADIVALLATYQDSPLMLLTTKQSGIKAPADLRGKRIMMTSDATKQVEVLAMLLQAGISQDDFTRQNHSFNLQSLINGDTDAMASYVSNEPFQMEQLGLEYNIIHPKDYGFNMYSDLLFTSGQFLQQNPELVKRFRRATISGWLYALSNIEETADIIHSHYNSQQKSRDALIFEGNKLAELTFDREGNFGYLDNEQLQVMTKLYLLFNMIDSDYDLSGFIYQEDDETLLHFSAEELAYINNAAPLKACGDPLWAPYSQLDFNQYKGIIPDYMDLIQQRSGLRFKLVTTDSWNQTIAAMKMAECDLIDGAMRTHNRSRYMDFTRPYLSMPAVMAVTKTYDGPLDLDYMMRQKIAIVRNQAFNEIMLARYPDANILPVDTLQEGLQKVQHGEVAGLIDAADSISNIASRQGLTEIKIIDLVHDNFDISIAINPELRDTPLQRILDKTISSISRQEKDTIRNRWVTITYEHQTDYTLMWQILLAIALLAIFLSYRYRIIQQHNKKLSEIAQHDQLTGLYNRRMMSDLMEDSVAIAKRYGRPLSLIFFDLDDFKHINDRFGHNSGDQVLKQLAQLLKNNCRQSDYFGRWGGEEFLMILPESTLEDAQANAEKIRSAIEHHDFRLAESTQITGSFGVAMHHDNETAEQFINRADLALYRAKSAHKNCVVADTSEAPSVPASQIYDPH